MRLASVGARFSERPAVIVDGEDYVPLDPFLDQLGLGGCGMPAVLGILPGFREQMEAFVDRSERLRLGGTRLGAPVPRPTHLFAVGANTHSHVAEAASVTSGKTARTPLMITLAVSSVSGPQDDIVLPWETSQLDYEVELAVVIGQYAHRIAAKDAMDHVAGFLASNDVTARDVQTGVGEDSDFYWQHSRSKSYSTFNPMGPWIVTPDEVGDLSAFSLQCFVNDKLRQDSDLTDLVASVPQIIESFSAAVPLYPGDVILTGSPAGVGALMDPPSYLQPGDVLRTVVSPVGELVNTVVGEAVRP